MWTVWPDSARASRFGCRERKATYRNVSGAARALRHEFAPAYGKPARSARRFKAPPRSASNWRSQPAIWFQLAKVWLAAPRVECAERPPSARESKDQFSPRLELVRSDEISHPPPRGANIRACVGRFFETRRACLQRFFGGTFPFAKTHKHLDTRLREPAGSHIAARLQAAGPSHDGPPDWIERRGSMPRVIPRSDT